MHRPGLHAGERTIPERIDLYGFTTARCNHPVINLRVHPRELHSGRALMQQPIVWINTDTIGCAPYMPCNTILECWEEFFQQCPVSCHGSVAIKCMAH